MSSNLNKDAREGFITFITEFLSQPGISVQAPSDYDSLQTLLEAEERTTLKLTIRNPQSPYALKLFKALGIQTTPGSIKKSTTFSFTLPKDNPGVNPAQTKIDLKTDEKKKDGKDQKKPEAKK